jgi:hypothetical protein
MGWLGLTGARKRPTQGRARDRHQEHETHAAVVVDRPGSRSALPRDVPRRRDFETRWDRR